MNAALPVLIGVSAGDEVPQKLLALLPDDTLSRASRFSKPLRRTQFLWGRVLLSVVGRRLSEGREFVEIIEIPPAAPSLRVGDRTFFTSVSHSADRVYVAVDVSPCAVDVERMDASRPLKRYADVAFNRETASRVKAEPDILTAFYKAWGAYECAVKAGVPRDFFWADHAPGISGFSVETKAEDGWMLVTAARSPFVLERFIAAGEPLDEVLLSDALFAAK